MDKPKSYKDIKTGRSSLDNWLKINYNEFYNYIKSYYGNIDIKTALYMYYNNIDKIPLCPCGKPVKFHGYQYGFSKFCCPSCASKNEDVQNKLKNTCIERYGEDYIDMRIENTRKTKLIKYGDVNYNNPKKSKQTCIERYGVDNPMKSPDIKQKSKQTCIERYGNETYLGSQIYEENKLKYINKTKQTCIERYGVDCVMKCNHIKNKVNNTCMDKYGVPWNCMREEAHNSRNYNSGPNMIFKSLLEEYGIMYEREFIIDNKSFDFKIDNTLIEINPSPTHNVNWNPFGGKIINKYYHFNKTKLALDNGYNLIHVWDWDNIYDIINMFTQKDIIYARKCIVKEIGKKENDLFLNTFHLQKTCKNQKIRLGLFYNDSLVGVMTFGKPRYNKSFEYELLRLCYHNNYIVIGGSQKLFSYFIKKYNPNNIISYCDNSKFNGKIYEKLGFNKLKIPIPSRHWYNCKTNMHITDNLLRQHGYDQLFGTNYGKGINNDQLMRDSGFIEIYDAGQMTWTWIK